MPRQLVFDLPVRTALGRGDYFVSTANAEAVARIEATADWPNGKLALVGAEGAGKTHLAHVWAKAQDAGFFTPGDDPAQVASPMVVEDADRWPGEEETLLHLYNLATERGLPLLLTARTPPVAWSISLPDLKSRLSSVAVTEIGAPDDALLMAVLTKLFDDRQIAPKPSLISFLLTRIERSFRAADRVVAELDGMALAEGRPPSRVMARRLLGGDDEA